MMNPLVVRPHRPFRFAFAIIAVSMLAAMTTWFLLDEAHWSIIRGRLSASAERQRLLNANRELEQGNASLQERVTALERTASLDKQTETFLQNEIRGLQDETFRLKGELAFYQGVMEAAGQTKGLAVQDIYVRRLPTALTYQLKLVLTNVSDDDAEAAGIMGILIEGRQNGTARLLSLTEVAVDAGLDMAYKFRNFKRFAANLQLPAGFAPQRVLVELQPTDKKTSKIKKAFDWPATAN
ncbi:MAG: hypothetical protein HYR49_10185 [Gammaproteobacteria bacterium]|nr:hypothetical protein [Gammaproteobacteria bacterium]